MPHQAHTLMQISGRLGAVERWSCSLRFRPGIGGGPGTPDDGDCDDVLQDFRKFLAALSSSTGRITCDEVKAYRYADGANQSLDLGTAARSTLPVQAPPATALTLPPQSALVVSFLTADNRTPRYGRMYVPLQPASTAFTSSGHLSSPTTATFAAAAQTLCNDLNNWPGVDTTANPGNLHVMSEGTISNPAPHSKRVTGVRVGNVVDTMRSRRRQLVEAYTVPLVVED